MSVVMKNPKWNEASICEALKYYTDTTDFIPTSNYLKEIGRNDLSSAIGKHGGWKHFSELMKIPMKPSDTLKGWAGEESAMEWLYEKGYSVERQSTRTHFDIMLNGLLRIDVKAASYAKYGVSSGWFYRMGKIITSDLVICARMDKKDFYVFPWFRVPATNLTITPTGKAHIYYYNNTAVIDIMLKNRKEEFSKFPECVRGVK